MFRKIAIVIGLSVLLLTGVLLTKTFLLKSKQFEIGSQPFCAVSDEALQRLSGAIQIETVSYDEEGKTETSSFSRLHKYLDESFPLIRQNLLKEKFNGHALLYRWQGKNESLSPVILMAHQDVVPANAADWEKSPFSGENDGAFIWGRGTLDDKGSLMSILEAVELLLQDGFQPEQTIYLAFGNDEEVGGKGAQLIAQALKQRAITADFILDEGMVITSEMVPMMNEPVALIGTSEKGYLTMELSCQVEGGHSASPQPETAISILSKAITRLTENRLPAQLTRPVVDFIDYLGPEISWPAKIVFANHWLFGGLIKKIYTGTAPGNSLVRTTTAPTVLQAGMKENVLPMHARAVVNFRLLPGETVEGLLAYVERVVDDSRVSLQVKPGAYEAAPVSSINSRGFELIHKTIKMQFPNTVVTPTLMTATSDSRHYRELSPNIFRFAPYHIYPEDMSRIHGINERIAISNYKNMVGFYYLLIRNTGK